MELFSLIPSLLVVQFFRRIRSRDQHSPLRQALIKLNPSFTPNSPPKKRTNILYITFPYWCVYLAYILSFLLIILSIFFIIIRGIEFGDLKVQQWLTSIVTGLVSSIVLTQPMKVISLAIFFTCCCRDCIDLKEENEFLDDDRFEIHDENLTNYQRLKVCFFFIS